MYAMEKNKVEVMIAHFERCKYTIASIPGPIIKTGSWYNYDHIYDIVFLCAVYNKIVMYLTLHCVYVQQSKHICSYSALASLST